MTHANAAEIDITQSNRNAFSLRPVPAANTSPTHGMITATAGTRPLNRSNQAPDTSVADDTDTPATGRGKSRSRVIERVPADPKFAPLDLKIDITKHKAYAITAKYQKASDYWVDFKTVVERSKTFVVKPNPKFGDQGIPNSQDKIDELAKQVYDAIIDFRYIYGTQKSPVSALLKGEVDEVLLMKRSYDLVNAAIEFHNDGFPITLWSNLSLIHI